MIGQPTGAPPGRSGTNVERVLPVVLALAAALLYAAAAVLQQRAASEAPQHKAMRPALMFHLLRRPLWLVGYVADWVAFGCEALALGLGSLLVVQPLLATGLLFALPIEAHWSGRGLRGGDWLAAGALCAGLVGFIVLGAPHGGSDQADLGTWAGWGTAAVALVGASIVAGLRTSGTARAVLFALATGTAYGLTAALTKSTVSLFGEGLGAVLTAWEPYALAVMAGIGMLANQSAFQAGSLSAALPTQTCSNQLVGIGLGIVVFHEELAATSALEWAGVVLSIAAMGTGVIMLARSAGAAEDAALARERARA
jgi:hypothetical protein